MRHRHVQGIALILVAGVLGVLAVLGLGFVTLAQLERRASAQRLYATRAGLLARSGIEDALARLGAGQDTEALANRYGGENWDGRAPPTALELAQEVYQPGTVNEADCPLRQAMRPSFFARLAPGNPDPALVTVNGRRRGYSGSLSGDRSAVGGCYALKVAPLDGLYVNGGDLGVAGEGAPGATYNTALKGLLGNLAEEIGPPLARPDGERLVSARPAGGWRSLVDLRDVALGGSQAKLDAFRSYLTLRAWVDKKVIRPNLLRVSTLPRLPVPQGAPLRQGPQAWAEWKTGNGDPSTAWSPWSGGRRPNPRTRSFAPDFERDAAGRIVGRAPVNLNWARRKPALVRALVKTLSGAWIDEDTASMEAYPTTPEDGERGREGGYLGYVRILPTTPMPPNAIADAVVGALEAHDGFLPGPAPGGDDYPDWDGTPRFDSWDEFNLFVDRKLTAIPAAHRDMLKAAFNPNSDLNKFNPGRTLFRRVDKSDLLGYGTEFSFETPLLSCACVGRILDGRGRLLAERTLEATLAQGVLRLTTQSEFCADALGSLDEAGDESVFRPPGAPGFIAPSLEPDPCFGARLLGNRGQTLQSYPEPQRPGPCPPPAAYDGRLELATTETPWDPAVFPRVRFLASWSGSADADVPLAGPGRLCLRDRRSDPGQPGLSVLGDGDVTGNLVNLVYPDGGYSECGRVPAYWAAGNLDGFQGILSTWFKPNFDRPNADPYAGRKGSLLFNLAVLDTPPPAGQLLGIPFASQVLALGCHWIGPSWEWGIHLEPRADPNAASEPIGGEGGVSRPLAPGRPVPSRRWSLLTMQWNFRADAWEPDARRLLFNTDAGALPYGLESAGPPQGSLAQDITRAGYRAEDGSFGRNVFCLGYRGWTLLMDREVGSPDGTFDEFMLLDRVTDTAECDALANLRFRAGRYYKGDRADWQSGEIGLAPGTRLLRAFWTLNLPRYDPRDPEDPNRAFFGTGADPFAPGTADAQLGFSDSAGNRLPRSPVATATGASLGGYLVPDGPFRLAARLRSRLGDNVLAATDWTKLNVPLLESPALDDVTLFYAPRDGPRLLSWGEGED